MWKQLIEKYQDNNNYIKINLSATNNEITKLEKKLKIKLPEELKSFLMELNGDNFLMFSASQIIETNISARKAFAECYENIDSLLFIGGNGCGDYYAYTIINGEILSTEIVRWEHEDNSQTKIAKNLEELINKYYTDQA